MTLNSKWRMTLAVILLVAALAAPGGAFSASSAVAQSEPSGFKNVILSVFPEYDDPLQLGVPTVLVMLDGEIEGVEPPTTVRFLVPAEAVMYSAGSGPRDSYEGGPPDRKASDVPGWDEISYELQTRYFVVEYYVPIQATRDRAFSVNHVPLYPINHLVAFVQEPLRAANFMVVTREQGVTQRQFTDDEGFNTRSYAYDALDARQTVSFSLSYTRKTTVPSVAIGQGASNLGPILGGVLGGGLLLGVVAYLVLRKPSTSRPRRARVVGSRPQARGPAGGRFCTECGARLEGSQRFCGQCGAKVRE